MTEEIINHNYRNDGFVTMKRWLENRNQGKTFDQYLLANGYSKVSIYGVGDIGKLLFEELKNTKIQILYFVDRNAEGLRKYNNIPVVTIDKINEMPESDVMIVTPIARYDSINKLLLSINPEIRTISIQEAVHEF